MPEETKEPTKGVKLTKKWLTELKIAEENKQYKRFRKDGEKAVERYLDEKLTDTDHVYSERSRKTNVLWSNVETLRPVVYNNRPAPDIRRRKNKKNPTARLSAEVLESATDFQIDAYDFNYVMNLVVEDRLLPGRGVARVRYKPDFERATDEKGGEYDRVVYEEVICEYVPWKDFIHSRARTWDEVKWVAFRQYLSRDELIENFGDIGKEVKRQKEPEGLDEGQEDHDRTQEAYKQAEVWEVWDKNKRTVVWVSPGYKEGPLKEEEDPLGLDGFFPCPRPLLATTTSLSLIPRADYFLYKDQADEIDSLTDRIDCLLDSLRVVGVCDWASFNELKNILEKDNEIIPVKNWPQFQKSGGFEGVIQWMPVAQIAGVLEQLYAALDRAMARMYEIIGIPDIMRGMTDPLETARAQHIKTQYAQSRVSQTIRDVERFCRDMVALISEVIAEHFSPETLYEISGIEYSEEQVTPEEFQAAIELLRDDVRRNYRLDIETDSTVAPDMQAEKEMRNEFLGAVTPFLDKSLMLMQQSPEFAPTIAEMLMFVVRGYKAGRTLEETLQQGIDAVQQAAAQPAAPPPPDPEMLKIQLEQQKLQQEGAIEQAKLQADMQEMNAKLQMDQQKLQAKIMDEQQQAQKVASEAQSAYEKVVAEIEKIKADVALKAQDLQLKEREVAIKEADFLLEREKAEAELAMKAAELRAQDIPVSNEGMSIKRTKKISRVIRDPETGRMLGAETEEVPIQ